MQYESHRQHVVALCLRLSSKGYFAATGGNIMLRVDQDHVLVTPSATDYQRMQARDVCVLRLADLKHVDGAQTPSVESSLHASVMRLRPDVHCTVHTHQPVASACALLGEELAVPARWRESLGSHVPVVGYAPSGTRWLAGKLKRLVRSDVNAYLMRNHGVLCCGADSTAAMTAVENLEWFAQDHLSGLITMRAASDASLSGAIGRLRESLSTTTAPG